jgi:hypothetical protein
MRGRHSVRDLNTELHTLVDGKRAGEETVSQRFTLDQFGDEIWRTIVTADVIDGDDVRVIEGSGSQRLLLEAPQAFRIGRKTRSDDLDRDIPMEAFVARAIHLAHPARAQ